jgi:hypothetical protein
VVFAYQFELFAIESCLAFGGGWCAQAFRVGQSVLGVFGGFGVFDWLLTVRANVHPSLVGYMLVRRLLDSDGSPQQFTRSLALARPLEVSFLYGSRRRLARTL